MMKSFGFLTALTAVVNAGKGGGKGKQGGVTLNLEDLVQRESQGPVPVGRVGDQNEVEKKSGLRTMS